MEKFAVDLEKVLDEFEFNEEREEQDTTTVVKNQPLPHLGSCQVSHNRPPAASYRRPSFEPINLSEADFAASPPSTTPHFNSISIKPNLNKDPGLNRQNGTRNRNYIPTPSSIIPDSIINIKDVIVESKQELRSDGDSWPGIESLSSIEEKPDLLESKPNDYLKDVIIPPQLPDVTTSVWSVPNGISPNFDESLKNAPLCDLIHSSNGNLYDHIKHNNALQENVLNNVADIHTNFQLNSNVNVSSGIEENTLFSKYNETIHTSEPPVFNPYIYTDAKSIQKDLTYHNNNEKDTKKTAETSEFYEDNDGNFGQSVDDMYKTLNKEDVGNHKEEISGSLNTLHQATELQHEGMLNNNAFLDEDDTPNKISELSKSFLNKDSKTVTAEMNINKISNFNKASSNHDREEENECNKPAETNISELNKSNESVQNSLEFMQNVISCKQNTTENNLCNKDINIKPIGFTSNNNIADSELQQYLDELEYTHNQELCLNAEQSKFSKDMSLDESNIFTANKSPETNEKPCNLENKSVDKKSSNTNRNDTNFDLSLKLYDHINSVDCILQSSCADLNPNISPVIVGDNSTELSSIQNEQELGNEYQSLKKENAKDCENDLATELSLSENPPSNVTLNSQNVIPLLVENVSKNELLENSEIKIGGVKPNRVSDELMSNVETQVLDKPIDTNVEISNKLHEEEPYVESPSVKSSELSQRSEVMREASLNHAKQEDSGEHSFTEDISGDSESSNSYMQKVVKYKEVFGNEDVQHFLEKENTVDCDSLISQESLEEDSFNKTLNLNAHSSQSIDSPSASSNSEYDSILNVSAKMIPVKTAVECISETSVDEAGVPAEEDKPSRPNSLELPAPITVDTEETSTSSVPPTTSGDVDLSPEGRGLGRVAPVWVPDSDAPVCMQCQLRFTVIKRRHHCRACGQVLCSKCCSLKARLEFCGFSEVRVCQPCFSVLETVNGTDPRSPLGRQPNPNNPMEYCSTIPPLQQVAGSLHQPPPSVMVPVGVLKREGRGKSDVTKQVMFSDGIRPGGDLTELDGSGEPRIPFRRPGRQTKRVGTPPGGPMSSNRRALDPTTQSFIPKDGETALPPVVTHSQGELIYTDHEQPITLNDGSFKFAVNRNLNVHIKRVLLDCCVNRECWCISSDGLSCVGQDEVVFLLECLPQETLPPKDVFLLINSLYQNAAKGTTVSEMSFTPTSSNKLLGSRDHGGFLYIRPSYQCTAQLVLPPPPYLFALLIHRWESPWARLFPIRLVLRLGAEFRYYPCPLVSVRHREPLYTDIGHTIINLLADFRKYSYTLPTVRGLVIHMEDRQTSILLPRNRYDQVIRALNNSNDSVLAFGANFSVAADSHLVCMQSTEDESTSYHTQAINIHNKPRRVTGASFVVFNGALKTPGLAGKSNIVEDGLMVQVPSETMIALRTALRDMHDYTVGCGPNAEETVLLQWTADDTNFNIGVKSCIDGKPLDGVPSIRVHSGTDYTGSSRLIRWTEVFILQSDEGTDHTGEPLDISRLSGSIAQATCLALVPLLDLLSAASLTTIAVRANIHPENVGYEAGGNGEKLPPFYMKSLDDELVAVVHQAALAAESTPATLELVFRIMEQG